jgi:hypothetical protein
MVLLSHPGTSRYSASISQRPLSSRLLPIHLLTLCSLDTGSVVKEPTDENTIFRSFWMGLLGVG